MITWVYHIDSMIPFVFRVEIIGYGELERDAHGGLQIPAHWGLDVDLKGLSEAVCRLEAGPQTLDVHILPEHLTRDRESLLAYVHTLLLQYTSEDQSPLCAAHLQ